MNILEEAAELINGERAKDYGPVDENFQRIADLWTTYLGNIEPLTVFDVSNMMILVKVARIRSGSVGGTDFHRDSFLDIAGYAALAEVCKCEIATSTRPTQDFWEDIDAKIVEAQEKRERDRTQKPPRVWESIKDIPEGVVAQDKHGWCWKVCGVQSASSTNGEDWSPFDNFFPGEDDYRPFTEVLDTERAEARSSSGPASPDRAEQKGSK